MNIPDRTITDHFYLQGRHRISLLVTLLIVSMLSQIDRILPFIMSEAIKKDLGLTDAQLGLINGPAFALCYSLAALPLARLSDGGWSKRILIACILVWSIMTGLGGFAASFIMLSFLRLGVALGEAGGAPASHALITQYIVPGFRGRAIGLIAMGIPLGTMLGFVLGGWSSDHIGWRNTFMIAGISGIAVAALAGIFTRQLKKSEQQHHQRQDFLGSARMVLQKPAFKWLFVAANLIGFASAPFYIFSTPFLIRKFDLTATKVGLRFGLLQGLMGIAATIIGGKYFDRSVLKRQTKLLKLPAMVLILSAITTATALFMPSDTLTILLMIPGMFSFAFALPFAFGTGHIIAGRGNYAMSSSLLLLATGLLGPSISPILVGFISDHAGEINSFKGLQIGLLTGPVASILCAVTCFCVKTKYENQIT